MDPATTTASTTTATTTPGTPPAGTTAAAETQQATGQQTPPGQQAATTTAPRTFTQEDVNRIAASAREEGRQSALKKATEGHDPKASGQQQGTQATQPPNGGAQPNVNDIVQQAVTAAMQAAGVDRFTITARSAGYTDAQIQLARTAHDAAKPEDLSKWLTEWPAQVGMQIKPQGQGAGGVPNPLASQGAMPRKVEDLRDEHGIIDVFSLTPEQVVAMGPAKIREEFEKALERNRQLSGAPPLPAALRRK